MSLLLKQSSLLWFGTRKKCSYLFISRASKQFFSSTRWRFSAKIFALTAPRSTWQRFNKTFCPIWQMWPVIKMKSSPKASKNCPKSSNISLYLKRGVFKKAKKSPNICGTLKRNLTQRIFKNRRISSHCLRRLRLYVYWSNFLMQHIRYALFGSLCRSIFHRLNASKNKKTCLVTQSQSSIGAKSFIMFVPVCQACDVAGKSWRRRRQ